MLEGIFQLNAADTTRIYAVTEELRQKNIELAALNLRLRKYGENVDELTRSKERLETKSRIHGELAQTGQLVWPIPVFALAGIFFLMAGFVILRKPGKQNA